VRRRREHRNPEPNNELDRVLQTPTSRLVSKPRRLSQRNLQRRLKPSLDDVDPHKVLTLAGVRPMLPWPNRLGKEDAKVPTLSRRERRRIH